MDDFASRCNVRCPSSFLSDFFHPGGGFLTDAALDLPARRWKRASRGAIPAVHPVCFRTLANAPYLERFRLRHVRPSPGEEAPA
jgi:hypothetical protein